MSLDVSSLGSAKMYRRAKIEWLQYLKSDEYKAELKARRLPEITKTILDHFIYNFDKPCLIFDISEIGEDNKNNLLSILDIKGFICFIDAADILTIST